MGDFKDLLIEWRYREGADVYLAKVAAIVAVVSRHDQEQLIVDAFARGVLSLAERDDAIQADLVVRAQRRTDGSAVLLVGEVAPELSVTDVEDAVRRARIWAKLGTPTQPLAAGLRLSAAAEQVTRAQQITISLMAEPCPENPGEPPSRC
jgi:hypothetical protein